MSDLMKELEVAKAKLQNAEDKFERYDGNNPDKYRSEIQSARADVRSLTEQAKAAGLIAKTEDELLYERLDAAFPNAKSRQVVEFEGKMYRRRFSPGSVSNSGKTVKEWVRWWEPAV